MHVSLRTLSSELAILVLFNSLRVYRYKSAGETSASLELGSFEFAR